MENEIKFPSIENTYLKNLLNSFKYEMQELQSVRVLDYPIEIPKRMMNIDINIIPPIKTEIKNYINWYTKNKQKINNTNNYYEQIKRYDKVENLLIKENEYLRAVNDLINSFIVIYLEYKSIKINFIEFI